MTTLSKVRAFLLSGCAVMLAGCGAGVSAPSEPVTTSLGRISGTVHGGQQPVGGSHVYVLAVGTGGYGTASSSLLLPGPGTAADSNGRYYVTADQYSNFTVTGDYVCTAGAQVYLYVSGGNAGSGSNSAIGLMAVLGTCPPSGTLALQVPFVIVNEVSTVVAAYALAGFGVDGLDIASSGTTLAQTGVANAMGNALNMINVSTAQVPSVSVAGNAQIPVQNVYTLADMLASCINSAGAGSTTCQTLLTSAGNATDTAAAAIAMAHAPFTNVAALYSLVSASSPFQPALTTVPADLTLALHYLTPLYQQNLTASIALSPFNMAFDSNGNLWNLAYDDGYDAVTEFIKYAPTGVQLFTAIETGPVNVNSGFEQISVDRANNAWAGTVQGEFELSSQGVLLSPAAGYNCPGMVNPISQAFASNGAVYIGDQGPANGGSETIYELSSGGVCQGTLTASSSLSGDLTIASSGNVYSTEQGSSRVGGNLIFDLSGGPSDSFPSTDTVQITADGLGSLWTMGSTYIDLRKYSDSGTLLSPVNGYTGGGLVQPTGVVLRTNQSGVRVDGANQIWLAIQPCVSAYGSACPSDVVVGLKNDGTAITPSTGLALPSESSSGSGIGDTVPDGSGNLWLCLGDGSLVEYVGLTVPVATPILPNQLGQRP